MKKLVIEVVRTDVDKLIDGLKKFAEEYDDHSVQERFVELQFIQGADYLIILKLDRKARIKI